MLKLAKAASPNGEIPGNQVSAFRQYLAHKAAAGLIEC